MAADAKDTKFFNGWVGNGKSCPGPPPPAAAAATAAGRCRCRCKKKKKAAEWWPLLAETTTQLIGRQDNTSKQKGRMVAWWGPAFAFLRFDLKLET
jgi:hypothetical protein